jgi:hypothetical protein
MYTHTHVRNDIIVSLLQMIYSYFVTERHAYIHTYLQTCDHTSDFFVILLGKKHTYIHTGPFMQYRNYIATFSQNIHTYVTA